MKRAPLLFLLAFAVALYAHAGEDAQDPEVLRQVETGADLLEKNELEKAGEVFLTVLREHPENTPAVLGLLRVSHLYAGRGNSDRAIEWIDRTLAAAENKCELRIAAATIHIKENNEPEALEQIRKAVEADPDSPLVLSTALTCLAELDRFDDESRKIAERLLTTGRSPIDAYLFLGLWHQRNERFDEARNYFLKAVFLDTNNMQSRVMLGKLYEKMGKLALAEREYIKMTRIMPRHFSGHLCLAELYEKTGDEDLARRYADRASRLKEAIREFQQQDAPEPAEDKKQEKPE